MVSRQWGNQVEFSSSQEIQVTTSVAKGQIVGWVGYQTMPSQIQLDAYEKLNGMGLDAIADYVASVLDCDVKYITISWNEQAENLNNGDGITTVQSYIITDLRIAVIAQSNGGVTFNASDLRSAIFSTWLYDIVTLNTEINTVVANCHWYILEPRRIGGLTKNQVLIIIAGVSVAAVTIGGLWYITHRHKTPPQQPQSIEYGGINQYGK